MVPFPRRLGVAALLVSAALASTSTLTAQGGNCQLFASDGSGGNLFSFQARSQATALIGNMGLAVPSLAMDPTTGELYAGEGQGNDNLHRIDPLTAQATLVGSAGLGFATISGLEFASDGTLYAAVNIVGGPSTGADHLAIIDKLTAATTILGPFGDCSSSPCTLEGLEGLSFDDQGILHAVKSVRGAAGAPGLYTIDPVTGAATFDKPLVDSAGGSPSGGFVSLQFCDCDSRWYAGTAKALGMATDGGLLAEVDLATGVFTYLGTGSLTGGGSLGGLARLHQAAVATFRNGIGCNPSWYTSLTPPIVGQTWQLQIDLAPSGSIASALIASPAPFSLKTAMGEFLVDVTLPLAGLDIAFGTHTIPLAPACGLIGFPLYTQGAVFKPGVIQLTNAVDVVFGSF